MTDRELYRMAFMVKAPEGTVRRALEGGRPRRRRTIPRVLLAAALIGALLVASDGAAGEVRPACRGQRLRRGLHHHRRRHHRRPRLYAGHLHPHP